MEFPLIKGLERIVKEYDTEEIKKFRKSREPAYKVIEEYIRDTERVICGVMAVKNLLEQVKQDIEVSNEYYYYQVYSPDARKDSILLANKLYEKKLPLIEAKKDFDGSYIVLYKAQKACKFIHVPASVFVRLPVNKSKVNLIKDTLLYATIELLKIPILMAYINPRQSIEEWETIVKYDSKLDEWYPFKSIGRGARLDDDEAIRSAELSKVEKWLRQQKDLIVIGNYAYQQILRESKYKGKVFLPTVTSYEVLSESPEEHIKSLEKIVGSVLSVKKNESSLGFHGTKYSVFKNKLKLIDIYDSRGQCVPFIEINGAKYGTYHVIQLYFYIGLWISHKIKDSSEITANRLRDRLNKLIWTFMDVRNWYLRKHGISGIHTRQRVQNGLFDIFQVRCKGTQKNVEREFRIAKWKGDIIDKLMVITSYKPEIWKQERGSLLEESIIAQKQKRRKKRVRTTKPR